MVITLPLGYWLDLLVALPGSFVLQQGLLTIGYPLEICLRTYKMNRSKRTISNGIRQGIIMSGELFYKCLNMLSNF